MQDKTPLFRDFHRKSLSRKPVSAQQKMARSLERIPSIGDELKAVFSPFLDPSLLRSTAAGNFIRNRTYTAETTFWTFLAQQVNTGQSCSAAVQALQSSALARRRKAPASNSGAYCRARQRLSADMLRGQFDQTANHSSRIAETTPGFAGRRVLVVDGTSLSMPDTEANQEAWPQHGSQKKGCGFPQLNLVGCFHLNTGVMLDFASGHRRCAELNLFRQMRDSFQESDIVLGDRGFSNYADFSLFRSMGVDVVARMHACKKPGTKANRVELLGKGDGVYEWKRPHAFARRLSQEEKAKVPCTMHIREIKVSWKIPGHRTRRMTLVTTLLDPIVYPAALIKELYLKRWRVELFFRDLKTTMGIEVLRCESPEMVRKEILMSFIAYNCTRLVMWQAAESAGEDASRVSFKAVLKYIEHLRQELVFANARERRLILRELGNWIAGQIVLARPGRREPRVRKRRPKNYQLLTKPRAAMREIPHRSKYYAKASK